MTNACRAPVEKELISAKEAARIIGCDPQALRQRIKLGIWKFGERIPKEKTGLKCDTYLISRRKLYRYLGIEGGE